MIDFTTPPYTPEHIVRLQSYVLPANVYFANILGRESKATVWKHDFDAFKDLVEGLEHSLESSATLGAVHVAIAYPHFTRVYRYGDPRKQEAETNIYSVGIAKSDTVFAGAAKFSTEGPIGCIGELEELADDIRRWKAAYSVAEYLADAPLQLVDRVINPNKTKEYLQVKGLL